MWDVILKQPIGGACMGRELRIEYSKFMQYSRETSPMRIMLGRGLPSKARNMKSPPLTLCCSDE